MARRIAVLGVACLGWLAVVGEPAVAAEGDTGGHVSAYATTTGGSVSASCDVSGVVLSLDSMQAIISCSANATPSPDRQPVSTGISTAYAESDGGGSVSAPGRGMSGAFVWTVGTSKITLGKLKTCVSASAQFSDGSIADTGLTCNILEGWGE